MAVRIRLKKLGRKHRPFFRLCAMDARSPRNGRVIEELGTYDPMLPETDARAVLNGERIEYWKSVGALPTPKAAVLIKKYGKDGTHLDQQQHALNRLAARRSDSIAMATQQAAAQAEAQAKAQAAAQAKAEAEAKAKADAEAEALAAQAPETGAETAEVAVEDASAENAAADAETTETETASE